MNKQKKEKEPGLALEKPQEVVVRDIRESYLKKKLRVLKLLTSSARFGELRTRRERAIASSVQLCHAISTPERLLRDPGTTADYFVLLALLILYFHLLD